MKKLNLLFILSGLILWTGCGDDDAPPAENEEEVIDRVTLTFTPTGSGGTAIVVEANDPDGEGDDDFTTETINLAVGTTYTLAITVENTEEGENITEEIETEDDEHMFFFQFTTDIFEDPAGDGNVDARADDVNYEDDDDNNYPIGLETTWTTAATASSNGDFRVVLKHQPDIKSATSTSEDGESDIDITWTININE